MPDEVGVERPRIFERQARRGACLPPGALESLDSPHESADSGSAIGFLCLARFGRTGARSQADGSLPKRRVRQDEVLDAQSVENLARAERQIAAMSQEPPRGHREARNQIEPVAL